MSQSIAPEVLWAQRSSQEDPSQNVIYLTINVPDLQPGYSLTFPTPTSLSFKGTSGSSQTANSSTPPPKAYVIDSLELFGELDLDAERKEMVTGKSLQVQLTKKQLQAEYWPRLTKDKRVNFVKTDFARWVDQDEQDGAALDAGFASTGAPPGAGMDMDAMMAQMGGMGGMGGMGDMSAGMDFDKMMSQMKNSDPANGEGPGGAAQDSDDSGSDEIPALEEASA